MIIIIIMRRKAVMDRVVTRSFTADTTRKANWQWRLTVRTRRMKKTKTTLR